MGRSMAVVLFTDLVGSTELRGRLGEEAADELRRKHDRLLGEAVEGHAGRVVKGLGDGVMAAFGGASDAVGAAVRIQQAVDRLNRSETASAPLAVRVGLSAGDVSFEDDDVHGTPVVEAARLCATAAGGEILASDIVRWLAGAQDGPSFVPLGSLELKGLAAPVPAVRVVWEPAPQATIPMPALLTDVGRIFVGRDAELERLRQLWKEAAAGERRVALLGGEPGVGKTRLAAELAVGVHDEGGIVLTGRCDEDLGVPYQPFVEGLRHFVDHISPSELPDRLGRFGGELTRLVPELTERLPDLHRPLQADPETERYRLFDAVASWVGAAAKEAPLLFVLDDVQWAAKPTLLLLRHILRSPEIHGILFVATYRDTELDHEHPLIEMLADLRRQEGVERLSIVGLDAAGVAGLMEQAADHALDDRDLQLARAIHGETEGNPFFVREVLRHLGESGAFQQRDGRWVSRLPVEELGIPEGVRDVVGRRLARLSPDANRVLRVGAVIGADFDLSLLEAATADVAGDDLVSAIEEATRARLVLEAPGRAARYRFAHALVRDTIYAGLSAGRRLALHRRVAEAIESLHGAALDDHLPALAHHWTRASGPAAEVTKAVDYARRAGDRALTQFANDEAAAYYRQAIDLLDGAGESDDALRCDLLIALGEAQRRAGDPGHRDTLLYACRLAGDLGDVERQARAALANYRGIASRWEVVDVDRLAALERVLQAVEPADSPVRARLLAALACELYFATDERRHLVGAEAVAIARRLDDPATLASVLADTWYATWDPANLAERAGVVAELADWGGRLGDHHLQFEAGLGVYLAAMQQGDMRRADAGLAMSARVADELGQPLLRWRVTYSRANRAMAVGDFDLAEELARRALSMGEACGLAAAAVYGHASLAITFSLKGDFAAAALVAAPFLDSLLPFQAVTAWAKAELGARDEAQSLVDELSRDGFAAVPRDHAWMAALTIVTRAGHRLGFDASLAAELYSLLSPYRSEVAVVPAAWLGPVAYDLGLLASALGHHDDAERHFAAAVDIQTTSGAGALLTHSHLAWAEMTLARGDRDRARRLVGEALASAQRLGQERLAKHAAGLLQAYS